MFSLVWTNDSADKDGLIVAILFPPRLELTKAELTSTSSISLNPIVFRTAEFRIKVAVPSLLFVVCKSGRIKLPANQLLDIEVESIDL